MKIKELEGRKVAVSAHTITVKDDSGKTRGMVRGVTTLYDLRPNRQMEFARRLGPVGRDKYMGYIDRIFIVEGENEMYFLCDDYCLEMSRKYDEGKGFASLVDSLEKSGALNIIHCSRISWSERKK